MCDNLKQYLYGIFANCTLDIPVKAWNCNNWNEMWIFTNKYVPTICRNFDKAKISYANYAKQKFGKLFCFCLQIP